MKYILILISIFLVGLSVQATQRALTEEGKAVILEDDGTWKFDTSDDQLKIPMNPKQFQKPSVSLTELPSKVNDSSFWYDSEKWNVETLDDEGSKEFEFELKGKLAGGFAITEKVQVDEENLAQIAFANVKNASPSAKILKREYRVVNGNKLIYMEIEAEIKGMKFIYLGYFFADDSGCTQLIVFTVDFQLSKIRDTLENLLNGFIIRKTTANAD